MSTLETAHDLVLRMPERWGVDCDARLLGAGDRPSALILDAKPGEVWAAPSDAHIISIHPEGNGQHRVWGNGCEILVGTLPAGASTIVRAGVAPRALLSSPLRVLHVYLPHRYLARRATEDGRLGSAGSLEVTDEYVFHGAALDKLGRLIIAEIEGGCASGRLYSESLFTAIASRVLAERSNAPPTNGLPGLGPSGSRSTRSDWRIRRAIEHFEAKIGDDLGLDELAAEAGLSLSHFAARFRAGTGLSPHRWVMKRRVERACEMLSDPRRSVTEIAHALGFASSQHLATVFKKHVGATPSEYRRERLS